MASTRWTGRGDGRSWTDAGNWSAGVPASGVDAVFNTGGTEAVRLAGASTPLAVGALMVQSDTLTLSNGVLDLAPMTAMSGNTYDLVLGHGADVTVATGAKLMGSNVAEIGDGTGATLTVLGLVAEEYAVVVDGTLDVSGSKAHWLSGDSGVYVDSSSLVVEAGGHVDTGGKLSQYPAAALQIEGNSSALVTGAGSIVRLANTFVSDGSGTSVLTIADGGEVFSGGGEIGNDGDGTLLVTGAGSMFSASRGLSVGGQVPVNSKLLVENGGTVAIGTYGLNLDGLLGVDGSATFTAPEILSGGGTIMAMSGTVALSSKLEVYSNNSDPNETRTTYVEAAAGATLMLSGAISSGDPGDTSGTLDVASGHVVLSHDNTKFGGTTAIYNATLEIAAGGAAGTGGLAFVGGSNAATLLIDGGLAFGNVISGFGTADTIDLAGLGFGGSPPTVKWTPNASGGTLRLSNDSDQTQILHFSGSGLSATSFSLMPDGLGGTALTHS